MVQVMTQASSKCITTAIDRTGITTMTNDRTKFARTLLPGLAALITLTLGGCFLDDDNNDSRGGRRAAQPNLMTLNLVLEGDQEVPPVDSAATGSGTLQLNLDTGALTGSVTTSIANASMAHIHAGYAGENGPVVIALEASGAAWQVPANTVLDEEDREELLEGELYVNVHSDAHPDGELRAQILPEDVE